MGNRTSEYLAEAVSQGFDLEAVLTGHFRINHYPPLPTSLIDVAVKIIRGVNSDELDYQDNVTLPDGVLYRGQSEAPVYACIEAWHLEAWL